MPHLFQPMRLGARDKIFRYFDFASNEISGTHQPILLILDHGHMDEQSLLLQPQRKKKLSIVSTADSIATIQTNPNDNTILLNRIEPPEQLKVVVGWRRTWLWWVCMWTVGGAASVGLILRALAATVTTASRSSNAWAVAAPAARLSPSHSGRYQHHHHRGSVSSWTAFVPSLARLPLGISTSFTTIATKSPRTMGPSSVASTMTISQTRANDDDCSLDVLPSMSNFLQQCLTRLQQQTHDNTRNSEKKHSHVSTVASDHSIHVVIGNEAGDADSIVSAIAWAYVTSCYSAWYDHLHDNDNTPWSSEELRIPICSIPRGDLETQRPEMMLLLRLAGLDPSLLLYPADLDMWWSQSSSNDSMDVTLVDHNRLSSSWSSAQQSLGRLRVVEIVDHHVDEQLYLNTVTNRNIAFDQGQALVASACTLVVEQMQNVWRLSSGSGAPREQCAATIPAPLGVLLLGVILLDSINLSPSAGKVTERDVQAVQTLLDCTNWTEAVTFGPADASAALALGPRNHQPDLSILFNVLQNAKFAPSFWKSLSVRDALRLDYKRFSTPRRDAADPAAIGISTVLLPWSDFVSQENVAESIHAFMQEMNVSLFGIMLAYTNDNDGGLHRELVLVTKASDVDTTVLSDLVNYMLTHHDNPLKLTEMVDPLLQSNSVLTMRCFVQHNVQGSRKQVAPALLEFFKLSSS
jgi:exopolyphosphatase